MTSLNAASVFFNFENTNLRFALKIFLYFFKILRLSPKFNLEKDKDLRIGRDPAEPNLTFWPWMMLLMIRPQDNLLTFFAGLISIFSSITAVPTFSKAFKFLSLTIGCFCCFDLLKNLILTN